eukprot:12088990-Alexandrium_andersonii.AAC.1
MTSVPRPASAGWPAPRALSGLRAPTPSVLWTPSGGRANPGTPAWLHEHVVARGAWRAPQE